MLDWLSSVATSVAGWVGDGFASLFEWFFSGIITIVTAVINGLDSVFELLDSIWEFAIGFIDSISDLFTTFFPFVPESVVSVIFLGLFAVLLVGIIRKVRGS